jgi:3-oxoadipate enol-lactonase
MPETRSDGVRIAYRDEGSGRPVLLLHGHTLDGRMWDGVVAPLTAAGMRLLRPDLRGHGASERPPKGYHWSHHCADAAAVLDAAGIDQTIVAGFSLGGGIALELALRRPERVRALVLIDPVMPDRPFEAAFMDNLRQVARTARAEGIRAAMAGPWMASPLFEASLGAPGVRKAVAAIVADFPGAEYLASERDTVEREWRTPDRLAEITVPTLVLVGERDMPGFRAFAEEAASGIPGARLEVVPGAGHLVPLERPDLVAERILTIAE